MDGMSAGPGLVYIRITPPHTLAPCLLMQIGGSDTTYVKEACRLARPYNYDAINLNCGCPSEKVAGKGAFGAALMRSPSLVKDLCLAMRDGAGEDTPITVKCRIGVDNDDSYEQLAAFVDEVTPLGLSGESSGDMRTAFRHGGLAAGHRLEHCLV